MTSLGAVGWPGYADRQDRAKIGFVFSASILENPGVSLGMAAGVVSNMASQSLYRKWRSQKFGELIGQEPIIRTLKNALSNGKPAHAYLFTGPRGTGKTSTARLLAKPSIVPILTMVSHATNASSVARSRQATRSTLSRLTLPLIAVLTAFVTCARR